MQIDLLCQHYNTKKQSKLNVSKISGLPIHICSEIRRKAMQESFSPKSSKAFYSKSVQINLLDNLNHNSEALICSLCVEMTICKANYPEQSFQIFTIHNKF